MQGSAIEEVLAIYLHLASLQQELNQHEMTLKRGMVDSCPTIRVPGSTKWPSQRKMFIYFGNSATNFFMVLDITSFTLVSFVTNMCDTVIILYFKGTYHGKCDITNVIAKIKVIRKVMCNFFSY